MKDGVTVLLLRHGEIVQSAPRRFVGQRDLPLTATGSRQAAAWAPVLVGLNMVGQKLGGAWCSDLSRARDTAALALAGSGITATALPQLREISLGGWEGLSVDEVRQRFPSEYERRGADLAGVAPAGGESFAQAQDRAWTALGGIVEGRSGWLLVVAHAGINRALICRVLGLPLGQLFLLGQENCALNILEFPRQGRARLAALNLPPGGAAERLGLDVPEGRR